MMTWQVSGDTVWKQVVWPIFGRKLPSINTVPTLPPPPEEIKINSCVKLYAVGVHNT